MLIISLAPKKKQTEKMSLGTFLQDESTVDRAPMTLARY